VTSPSGMTELCDIQDLGTSQYSIKFIPKEMGIHTVSVKHRGMHIPGVQCLISLIFSFVIKTTRILVSSSSIPILKTQVMDEERMRTENDTI